MHLIAICTINQSLRYYTVGQRITAISVTLYLLLSYWPDYTTPLRSRGVFSIPVEDDSGARVLICPLRYALH